MEKLTLTRSRYGCGKYAWLRLAYDYYQNIHYDMEDLLEQANEIQESLGRSYAVPDELDEADLEAGMFAPSAVILPR